MRDFDNSWGEKQRKWDYEEKNWNLEVLKQESFEFSKNEEIIVNTTNLWKNKGIRERKIKRLLKNWKMGC